MRLGWSVLCRDFEEHDDGSLSLERVFADSVLGVEISERPPVQVKLNPPVILISHWFAESDLDKLRYPAVLRLLAPGDNTILEEWSFSIDFFRSESALAVFGLSELMYVGDGLYEFHIEVLEYGEWNILSRNGLPVRNTL